MAETKKRDEQIRDAMAELGFNPNDNNIPKSGGSGAIGSIYLPASNTAVPVGDSGYNPGEFKTPDPTKDRVGDYVQSAGGWDVVRNSPTDLANKFLIARASVNSRQNLSFEDFTNAAKVAALGSMGLPTNFSSAGDAIGTGVGAQLAKAGGAGAGWGILQGIQSLLAADKAYEDAYLSQNFDFDIGLKLFKDEAGNTRFLPDYAKMAQTGTPGESGSIVQNMLNTESTGAYMSADNKLNIDVSPVFAESAAYKQLLRQIKDTYGSLTKEQANSIADQDTGATVLDTISNLVKATESQYFYNTQMGRAIKNYAPTASDEAMNIALSTSKIGYLGDKVLESIDVQVYDDSNKLVKVNAKKYLDSIQSMDKIGRNNYMSKIESRLNDSNISDNEKAVLYAQANALRSASDSDGSYHGMYQRDWLDEIGSTTDPVFGLTWNTYFGGTDLDTFRRDEISAGLLDLGGTFASVKALTGITNINESLIRALPGARNVSRYAGESFAEAQKLATDASGNVARQALSTGLRTGTQVGFQLAADAVYDAVKAIPYALTGNDYDFKEELENDFMMDMLVTYGPRNFAEKASASKMEYRVAAENTKTGKIEYVRPSDIKNKDNYRILSDEIGMRDSKLVEVTSEELSKRRAATIAKLEDNKIVQSIQKNFFDKNAAFGKLAMQVKAVSDTYHYHKFMRNGAASIESITKDVMREWKNQDGVKNAWKELGTALKAAGVKGGIFRPRGLSQADNDYLKAVINEARFLGIHKDNKEKQERTKKFYAEGKKGVSKERAQELNNVLKAMQQVSAKILDFYQKKGLMSEKQVAKLRAAPGYENGFVPMYTVPGSAISGEVSQNRALLKRVKNADVFIALKDIENPLESIARYINNSMRAVAVNDRALAVREVATLNGVGIRVIKDDGGSLKEYKNLKATDKAFNMIYIGISKEVRASLPTFEEWQKANDQRVLRSNALKTAEKIRGLRDEAKALYNENRRLKRKMDNIDKQPVKLATDEAQKAELFDKIHVNRTLIADNKQQQLGYIDDIRRYTKNLMERAQKAHKGSNLKLDIDSYTNVQVMNALKDALKSENTVGKVQKMLNKAVERANPWVDPEDVIRRRAEAAAVNYRKKVVKDIKAQEKERLGAKGINMDKINALADKVMDKITKKIKGERDTEVTYIDTDDGMPKTEILTNYDRPNVIRYYLDGEMHTMVLEGKGAEELVAEFYAPEFVAPKTVGGHILHGFNTVSKGMAQAKRYLTTAADFARVLPNILRDWSRGIVSTGGQILLSPDKFFKDMQVVYGYSDEQIKLINNGLMLCHEDLRNSTLTASLQMPRKNREKEIIRALVEPDGNAFVRFVYDFKHVRAGKILSSLQDMAETFTRQRAMDTAYYKTLSDAQSRGKSVEDSIKEATEAAYFAGREATVNFRRRGAIIERFAQNVPYLTQRFATLESFKYSYVNDPIGFTRALTSTVSAYTAMIAIALSNDESKKKYMMLSEYDRANNIIIPIDNSAIITIPLDDTIAAFLTPYRRMVETLNGVDPEAFYLCFAEALEALSPIDFSGFSEGDGFNVARGFDKLEAEFVPTWAQPFLEMWKGRDLYYGSNLSIDSDYTGMMNDNWTPTPGELTTKGKNSQTLAMIADHTGIPQWILQNFLSEYGGNVGQYVLNTIDKLGGATEDEQGGKEWMDSVFKPFTGGDSDQATSDFYNIVNGLKEDKAKLQNEVRTLTAKINKAGGNDKAELIKERQNKIMEYGLHVTDAIENYLSAYEITGGLSKKLANQAWYLYKIYDEESNSDLYVENSTGDYYTDKASAWNYKQANALAAESGFDKFVHHPVSDYYDSYAEQAFKQTSYGDSAHYIAEIEDIMNKNSINRSEMFKNYNSMTSAQKKQWKAAWNKKVVKALAPYIQETGVDNVLDQRKVVDYLDEVIFVSNPWNTKQYLKQIFGGK